MSSTEVPSSEPVASAPFVEAQGLLFEGDFSPMPSDLGFRGPVACSAAGITYRQLDYWTRTDLVKPEVRAATGSGTQRLYSFRDILILKVIKRLIDAGISLQQIRTAIDHLRARGVDDLTQVTLMSDGVSVFECTSDDEVIDLLRGGRRCKGARLYRSDRSCRARRMRQTGKNSHSQAVQIGYLCAFNKQHRHAPTT